MRSRNNKKRRRPRKWLTTSQKRQKQKAEFSGYIERLNSRIKKKTPPAGVNPLAPPAYLENYEVPRKFEDLPLSRLTKEGLSSNGFVDLRDIQCAAIPHALAGRDILGAAKTGSGKTLAFVIPMLELLYRNCWSQDFGLGALIIAPTRELALQIFEVVQLVGKPHHHLSSGLVIGGKNYKAECELIQRMNILIGTPGRILQHFQTTYGFSADKLEMLVLDEADRILSIGFQNQLEAIIANLPRKRQTLMFSATMTGAVERLAGYSLTESYEKLMVHEADKSATPHQLLQTYIKIESAKKYDLLFTFLRSHRWQKILIFFATRKQVRFTYEMFRRLHPGIRLNEYLGSMPQAKRTAIYYEFVESKVGAMLATEIAARGLDFPNVKWVILFDCPANVDMYIHSVGRTARNLSKGFSLLFLQKSELKFVKKLKEGKVDIKKTVSGPIRQLAPKFRNLLASKDELLQLAKRAFISYVRAVALAHDKEVFNAEKLDTVGLAQAMGLPGIPKVDLGKIKPKGKFWNLPYELQEMLKPRTKKVNRGETYVDKMITRKNEVRFGKKKLALHEQSDSEDADDFFQSKSAKVERKIWEKKESALLEMVKQNKRKDEGSSSSSSSGSSSDPVSGSENSSNGSESETGETSDKSYGGQEAFVANRRAKIEAADIEDKKADRLRVLETKRQKKDMTRFYHMKKRLEEKYLKRAEYRDCEEEEDEEESDATETAAFMESRPSEEEGRSDVESGGDGESDDQPDEEAVLKLLTKS